MTQEQAIAKLIIALISEKNKSKKNRQKRKVSVNLCLKRRKKLRIL